MAAILLLLSVMVTESIRSFTTFLKKKEAWCAKGNIFLLFDYVHLLKSIRNNWITVKTQELEFYIDGEKNIAWWVDIINLYKLETKIIVKMSKLTEVSVYPKPIERQNVITCLHVFCDETSSTLKSYPDLHENEGTIIFISKVVEFWEICNFHSPYADVCLKDSNRAAIASANDDSLSKLSAMGDFAIQIKKTEKGKRVKLLTRDNANCLDQTCYSLVQLSKYLLDTTHQYVLLGNFTTDPLEKLFGKLRQGSGGTYFISVQQVLEKVTIYRTKLLLKFEKSSDELANLGSDHSCPKCKFLPSEGICNVIDNLPALCDSLTVDIKMSLVYIAGYIIREDENPDDTFYFYKAYGNFVKDINQGGLTIPGSKFVNGQLTVTFFLMKYIMTLVGHHCVTSI